MSCFYSVFILIISKNSLKKRPIKWYVTRWFKQKRFQYLSKNAQFGVQSKNTKKGEKLYWFDQIWRFIEIKFWFFFNYFQIFLKFYPEWATILTNLHKFVQEKHQKVTKIGLFKDCSIWSPINWAILKSKKEPVNLIWSPIGSKSPNLVTLYVTLFCTFLAQKITVKNLFLWMNQIIFGNVASLAFLLENPRPHRCVESIVQGCHTGRKNTI